MPARTEFRQLASIAVPVVIVQIGMMLMGTVDTLMVGHVSAAALAATALGNLYFYNCIVISLGTVMALDPVISQAVGAKDESGVTRGVQRGVLIALLMSIPTMLLMGLAPHLVFTTFGQPADVVPGATVYSQIGALSVIPFLLFVVQRQVLQAVGKLTPIIWTIVVANLLNAALNWVFIFGNLGVAPMGVKGSAIATVISRWIMALLLLVFAWPQLKPHLSKLDPATMEAGPVRRMLILGVPIGLQQFLEIGAFGAVGLLTGTFGASQVAAYQIALNMAALTFMVPLGVSAAAAVRVGNAVGAEDAPRAHDAARLSYLIGLAFMTSTAILFLLMPEQLAKLYTTDKTVIAIAGLLVPIAGLFQIFDGMQAVGAGVLRGLGDTRVPLIAMFAGYWVIGVPVSLYLGFRTSLGSVGLWWGFVAGLGSVALFLVWRVRVMFARGVDRVVIDRPRSH